MPPRKKSRLTQRKKSKPQQNEAPDELEDTAATTATTESLQTAMRKAKEQEQASRIIQPVLINNEHATDKGKGKKRKSKDDEKEKTAEDIAKDKDKPQRKKRQEKAQDPGVATDIDAQNIHREFETRVQLRIRRYKDVPVIKPFSLELIGDDFTVCTGAQLSLRCSSVSSA